jgi:hypothetical protein
LTLKFMMLCQSPFRAAALLQRQKVTGTFFAD